MDYQFVAPSSSEWLDSLELADHDFYHLPCYQTLSAKSDENPRAFFAAAGGHRLLLPFLQRPVPGELAGGKELFDVSSAYGYPGPIISRGAPDSFVRAALECLSDALSAENVICGFFRLHTILNRPHHFEGAGTLINHGPSVFIDLTHSQDELWEQTRRGHKRDLVVLQKRAYNISMNDWNRLDDFLKCYYDSMRRLRANEFYFFPKAYFEGLRSCLGDDRVHLCLVHLGDEIACAGLVTEVAGLCQYHLSATADEHFQDHPSKLMLHYLRGWLKARGNHTFHVGGGVGALRDSLHLFKSGFSPYSSDFFTWRLVIDEVAYTETTLEWQRLSGGVEPVDAERFFPQYRAPLAV